VAFELDPFPLIVLMGLGFLVGVVGHLTRTRSLVVIGIGLIFLATFVLPLATSVLKNH
jgi:type IV secretory pathway VirB2 component (pilin)